MSVQFSKITLNALYAVVDLFLDQARHGNLEGQRGNLSEFIIDCSNLKEDDAEFSVIKEKFEEEFACSEFYAELSLDEVTKLIERAINRLITIEEMPAVLSAAIDYSYNKQFQ